MAVKPAFQVIVLGPNGGPREDKVTGLLVRSTSTNWSPGSVVAVDAGTLLAGIIRLIQEFMVKGRDKKGAMRAGPFAGLPLPFETAEANAAHVFREIIGAVLITHPHLDHISGLAINTPILEAGSGPKPVAALPSALSAIKNHLFNDVIWPNLSDEDGGAGLLTYQRLVEGGNPRFGSGEARGYVRACNGIVTKCLSVSHGHCMQRFNPATGRHHRADSTVFASDQLMLPPRNLSLENVEAGFYSPVRTPLNIQPAPKEPLMARVESSAFFLRDDKTGKEIIIFGDVEPDSVSLDPHNKRVWRTAAPKVASGTLQAIFIECSYNDSVDDAYLYGHLCPRHLIAELKVLAAQVMEQRDRTAERKRKREQDSKGELSLEEVSPRTKRMQKSRTNSVAVASREYRTQRAASGSWSKSAPPEVMIQIEDLEDPDPDQWADAIPLPLHDFSVYIIHIKEYLTDGPPPGDRIISELRAHAKEANLGCEFFLPDPAEPIWL
ncbi:Cyclic-AMP phosphodiesterase class-II [Penicillium taxi]|uniref:Cyclic-AMP phosphodiesterase class-II n=1 Tax=Penicillium taxi TaxID=168475 RepID=UPI002544D49A|nr:Cyclic-AMP phosphodiesterase class-II [Penicillium taxi]KAJ5901694.1 Cyclic-AMP phosphodiesterase class-II [Penicillium taxi]